MAENEASVVFSQDEKASMLHHLGYPQVNAVSMIALGMPAAGEPLYLILNALSKVRASAAARIRRTLGVLEGLEAARVSAIQRLKASEVEGIVLNPDELQKLGNEQEFWRRRLADDLGVPVNPSGYLAQGSAAGAQPINFRVFPS